jgi:hypothetical protein
MLVKFTCVFVFLFIGLEAYSEERIEMKAKADQMPIWHYPYLQLIDALKAEKKTSLAIFCYGSLMDTFSAKRTLSQSSMVTRKPAIAYGIRRVFDRDFPICSSANWCVPSDPQARGMLNVLPTDNIEEFTNGLLIDVVLEDIPHILAREVGYDLIPIIVQDWEAAIKEEQSNYKIAYTFHAPQGSIFTNSTIMPRPGYYELTRNAAKQFGPLFFLVWFKTTYLSDGKTPIGEWEKQVSNF